MGPWTTLSDLTGRLPRTGWQATAPPEPYTTQLSPAEEELFQSWAKRNKIRMDPGWNEDYDMRGLWKASPDIRPDTRGHFPDTYKKPFHPTFSNESIYATPDAPHWEAGRLISPTGQVVADETGESLGSLAGRKRPMQPGNKRRP